MCRPNDLANACKGNDCCNLWAYCVVSHPARQGRHAWEHAGVSLACHAPRHPQAPPLQTTTKLANSATTSHHQRHGASLRRHGGLHGPSCTPPRSAAAWHAELSVRGAKCGTKCFKSAPSRSNGGLLFGVTSKSHHAGASCVPRLLKCAPQPPPVLSGLLTALNVLARAGDLVQQGQALCPFLNHA